MNKIIVQTDDKFIAVGEYYKNSNADFGIIRYNSNGSIDDQYGFNGIQNIDFGLNEEMANDFCLFSNNNSHQITKSLFATLTNLNFETYNSTLWKLQ